MPDVNKKCLLFSTPRPYLSIRIISHDSPTLLGTTMPQTSVQALSLNGGSQHKTPPFGGVLHYRLLSSYYSYILLLKSTPLSLITKRKLQREVLGDGKLTKLTTMQPSTRYSILLKLLPQQR